MRDLWRKIVSELMTPDDYQRDWYGHATNQAGHAFAVGFPIGMALSGMGPIWATWWALISYLLIWEIAVQRSGTRVDQLEDAGHVALGSLCAASAMAGSGVMMVVSWVIWALLTTAGVVLRIKFSSQS